MANKYSIKYLSKAGAEVLLNYLKEVRKTATMKNADFSEELKEKTRLWRDSWIIYPLDEAILMLERIYEPKRCDGNGWGKCPNKPIIRRHYRFSRDFSNLCSDCAKKDVSKNIIRSDRLIEIRNDTP